MLFVLLFGLVVGEDAVRVLLDEAWDPLKLLMLQVVVFLDKFKVEGIVPKQIVPLA